MAEVATQYKHYGISVIGSEVVYLFPVAIRACVPYVQCDDSDIPPPMPPPPNATTGFKLQFVAQADKVSYLFHYAAPGQPFILIMGCNVYNANKRVEPYEMTPLGVPRVSINPAAQGLFTVGVTINTYYGNFNLIFMVDSALTYVQDPTLFFKQQKNTNPSNVPVRAVLDVEQENQDGNSRIPKRQIIIEDKLNQKLSKVNNDDLFVQISVQSDILGLNLGEILTIINAKKSYPDGYPKKYIGNCSSLHLSKYTANGLIQTFYSKRPDFSEVLKGGSNQSSLFNQTSNINRQFNTGLSDCEFYNNVVEYAALKYIFAGLCSGCFSLNWLYSDNNKKFIKCMKNSEFAKFLVVFDEYGFTKYNKYFKSSPEHDCKR